jgi:hypothetical protein
MQCKCMIISSYQVNFGMEEAYPEPIVHECPISQSAEMSSPPTAATAVAMRIMRHLLLLL